MSITHPDRQLCERLIRLRGTDDGQALLKWLSQSLEDSRDAIMLAEGVQRVGQCQGAAQALKEVVNIISTADEIAHRLNEESPGRANEGY